MLNVMKLLNTCHISFIVDSVFTNEGHIIGLYTYLAFGMERLVFSLVHARQEKV